MALVLYTHPMSRGRVARWMLEEVGVPYEAVIVDWGAKPAALLEANPLGKVPTLVHDGRVVTESAAICLYLAEAFPAAALLPTPAERADYYRWTLFSAGPLEAAMTDKALGVDVPADRRAMVGYGSLADTVATLRFALDRHPFVAGERFTAADVHVGSAVEHFRRFGMLPDEPPFSSYLERLRQRPAWTRARAIDDALLAAAGGKPG